MHHTTNNRKQLAPIFSDNFNLFFHIHIVLVESLYFCLLTVVACKMMHPLQPAEREIQLKRPLQRSDREQAQQGIPDNSFVEDASHVVVLSCTTHTTPVPTVDNPADQSLSVTTAATNGSTCSSFPPTLSSATLVSSFEAAGTTPSSSISIPLPVHDLPLITTLSDLQPLAAHQTAPAVTVTLSPAPRHWNKQNALGSRDQDPSPTLNRIGFRLYQRALRDLFNQPFEHAQPLPAEQVWKIVTQATRQVKKIVVWLECMMCLGEEEEMLPHLCPCECSKTYNRRAALCQPCILKYANANHPFACPSCTTDLTAWAKEQSHRLQSRFQAVGFTLCRAIPSGDDATTSSSTSIVTTTTRATTTASLSAHHLYECPRVHDTHDASSRSQPPGCDRRIHAAAPVHSTIPLLPREKTMINQEPAVLSDICWTAPIESCKSMADVSSQSRSSPLIFNHHSQGQVHDEVLHKKKTSYLKRRKKASSMVGAEPLGPSKKARVESQTHQTVRDSSSSIPIKHVKEETCKFSTSVHFDVSSTPTSEDKDRDHEMSLDDPADNDDGSDASSISDKKKPTLQEEKRGDSLSDEPFPSRHQAEVRRGERKQSAASKVDQVMPKMQETNARANEKSEDESEDESGDASCGEAADTSQSDGESEYESEDKPEVGPENSSTDESEDDSDQLADPSTVLRASKKPALKKGTHSSSNNSTSSMSESPKQKRPKVSRTKKMTKTKKSHKLQKLHNKRLIDAIQDALSGSRSSDGLYRRTGNPSDIASAVTRWISGHGRQNLKLVEASTVRADTADSQASSAGPARLAGDPGRAEIKACEGKILTCRDSIKRLAGMELCGRAEYGYWLLCTQKMWKDESKHLCSLPKSFMCYMWDEHNISESIIHTHIKWAVFVMRFPLLSQLRCTWTTIRNSLANNLLQHAVAVCELELQEPTSTFQKSLISFYDERRKAAIKS